MDVIIMDMGADVKGESNLTDFKDKMELLSFSHGVAMQITGDISNSERTSGKPNHQDMTVTKYLDAASPVKHCEWMRTSDGSSGRSSPL